MATVEELEAVVTQLRRENAEFQAKTISVARRVAQENQLCGVIDRALREIGTIGNTSTRTFRIAVNLDVTMEMDDFFVNLSEAEIQEKLNDVRVTGVTWNDRMVGAVRAVANGQRAHAEPTSVVQDGAPLYLGLVETPNATAANGGVPPGYIARYVGDEGRVRHFFRQDRVDSGSYSSSLCAQQMAYRNTLLENSPRGENRNCRRCTDRAANL